MTYLKKRKAEKDFNRNKNNKKSRNHFVNFISLKHELKIKKSTNCVAIDRCVKSLKMTKQYINVFAKNQQEII
jgi:hypothetical protein